ncbi:MAG: ribosome maturation factor RimP [Candidatus Omnitrophica bacterium]|nr:ribosome maturation factor RimP [Candidatus Omnitrophota bacterium]
MDRQSQILELEGLVGDYLKGEGVDLIELVHHYEGRDLVLRFLVDKPLGGISIGECARLNREISRMMEERNILADERYILEVSSPGLDRPLKVKSDFTRCINRNVRFFLSSPVNGKIEWDGIINRIEGDSVYIDAQGNILEIPLVNINRGKQIVD